MEPTDKELLAAHVAGDPDAFSQIVYRHRDRLWAVALRTLSDPESAADALQDALISAYRRADQFRGDAAVTTWLHRIVVNACLDYLRKAKVRATVPLLEDVGLTLEDPRDSIGQRETQLAILQALAELPEDQRDAVVLVDVEGYSVDEAAALLECPTGTIKSRCSRGRRKLAERLEHLRNPDGSPTVIPPKGVEGSHGS
jgi:RNA polymerase sigma-70 factor, ECF subfamily